MPAFEPFKMPDSLTGDIRLLASPSLVAFPCAMFPMQLRGPRECQLLQDTLNDDQMVATVLLEPGWERYTGNDAPTASMTCLCRVVSHNQTQSDCWSMLLVGIGRASIRRELVGDRPYRQAEVRFREDQYNDATVGMRPDLKQRLIDRFRLQMPDSPTVHEQLEQLWSNPIPLGQLADIIAFSVQLPPRIKQDLLTELDVDRRATKLLRQLDQMRAGQLVGVGSFPPEFSPN